MCSNTNMLPIQIFSWHIRTGKRKFTVSCYGENVSLQTDRCKHIESVQAQPKPNSKMTAHFRAVMSSSTTKTRYAEMQIDSRDISLLTYSCHRTMTKFVHLPLAADEIKGENANQYYVEINTYLRHIRTVRK